MNSKLPGRYFQSTLFVFALLFLSGCTVASLDLRDELPETSNLASCDIAFTLDLRSGSHTNSYGTKTHSAEALKPLKERYIDSTLSTLNDLGCNARHEENVAESDFTIYVSRQRQISALPQEWLTGLSLGLIPSWGTRYGQFIFTFTDSDGDKTYTYQVDENTYNHLILFPVFWVSFFTADEQRAYTEALSNFINSA